MASPIATTVSSAVPWMNATICVPSDAGSAWPELSSVSASATVPSSRASTEAAAASSSSVAAACPWSSWVSVCAPTCSSCWSDAVSCWSSCVPSSPSTRSISAWLAAACSSNDVCAASTIASICSISCGLSCSS